MQYLVNGDSNSPSNGADRFNVVYGAGRSGWQSDETYANAVVPTAGKFKYLFVKAGSSPGSGNSFTFTLRVNGADSSLSVVLSDLETLVYAFGDVSVAAGDLVCLKSSPASSPTTSDMNWVLGFEPTNYGETIMLPNSVSGVVTASSGRFLSMSGDTQGDTTNEFDASLVMPISGTFTGMRGYQINSPGAGNSRIYTLRKNGVNTSMTFTIADSATTGSTSSNSFTVAAGDKVSLIIDEGGATSNTRIKVGVIFKPDNPDLFICSGGSPTNMTVGPFYNHPTSGFALSTSVTTGKYITAPPAWIALKMYAELDVAPGASQSRNFNSYTFLAQQGFQVQISGTNTQGSDEGALTCSYDLLGLAITSVPINLQITASAGVATASAIWSYACRDRNLIYGRR